MENFFNVEEILNKLEIRDTMIAAEFGCGGGIFSIALAKKLKEGRVYGLDILEEKLSALKNRAAIENISNIVTILCDLERSQGSTLRNGYLDLVLIPNILFQAERKDAIIEEGKRALKPGGQLLVVDWKKDAPLGPKEGRVSAEETKAIAEGLGLKLKNEFSAGPYHYGLLFIK